MLKVLGYEHVGIRVTDQRRALAFYKRLGFHPDPSVDVSEFNAVELVNASGVRLNLIHNGQQRPENRNILMDEVEKWPGITHVAFVVDSLDTVIQHMREEGVPITEGPLEIDGRRIICFIRDPDGNVVEFDELKPPAKITLGVEDQETVSKVPPVGS